MGRRLSSIELFAGAAGLGLGAKQSGVDPVAVVEWNKDCRNTLALNRDRKGGALSNWPKEIDNDVRDVEFTKHKGNIDIVTGGPPCQPFSMGGRHQAQADNRDMFPEAVRAVRQTRPKAFIFENVRGLTRESFQPYFEYITLQMRHPQLVAKAGEDWTVHLSRLQSHHTGHLEDADDYRVVTQVLNAADYGIPQQRHRVFFVGFRADLGLNWHFPQATHSKEALIHDIASGAYTKRLGIKFDHLALSPQIMKSVKRTQELGIETQSLLAWNTVREALNDMPEPTIQNHPKILNHRLQKGARSYPGHTGSPLDLPAKTLKAGVHGVPGGENMLRYANGEVRYFTVRESARLQTYPDTFEISGTWSEAMRQLGNAVPVALGAAVTSSVRETLVSNEF